MGCGNCFSKWKKFIWRSRKLRSKEEQNAGNNLGGHTSDDAVRFAAQMGSQPKLGIWAERRPGAGGVDCGRPAALGSALNSCASLIRPSGEVNLPLGSMLDGGPRSHISYCVSDRRTPA